MSVLGQKVTKLSHINYIQPGDTFLAVRGGVSYKVFGDRIASVEQLNTAKADYQIKIENLKIEHDNRFKGIDIRLDNISNSIFLKTDGLALSTSVFNLSSEVYGLKETVADLTYVETVSTDIVNWSNLMFAPKRDYVPLPSANIYSSDEGSVLTWNNASKMWEAGPGLSVLTKIDISPIGTIILHGGSLAPQGYLACNGQIVAKSDYPELWNTITDSYGRPNDLNESLFKLPDLSNVNLLASNNIGLSPENNIPITFYIKAQNVNPTSATSVLSSYLKISTRYAPTENQYLKYSNGEWVPSPVVVTNNLPTGTTVGSLLTWNGIDWVAGSSRIQSIYEHGSIVAYENSECVFTDIPSTAKKITLTISDLDIGNEQTISSVSGKYVMLRLGNGDNYAVSGYKNSCQGTYAHPYQRTSGGYYSYITNASNEDVTAVYILVRIDDFITKNETGGLDSIITFMRSNGSLLNSASTWVYSYTGRIGATTIQGAGSVKLDIRTPNKIGIFPPNPNAKITRGQMTIYCE